MWYRGYCMLALGVAVIGTISGQILFLGNPASNSSAPQLELPFVIPEHPFAIQKIPLGQISYHRQANPGFDHMLLRANKPLAELADFQATNVQFDDIPEHHVIDELKPQPTAANGSSVIPIIDASPEEPYGDPLEHELYDEDFDQSKYEWKYELNTGETGDLRPMDMDEHNEKLFIRSGININKGCPYCKCGVSGFERVLSGSLAKKYQYPWVSAYYVDSFFSCGGSLINNLFIATAAHCVEGVKVRRMKIILNDYNVKQKTESRRIIRKVLAVYTPIKYRQRTHNRDIALLRLTKRVPVGWGVLRPICLPRVGTEYTDRTAVVAGWGPLDKSGTQPKILHKVRVPIIPNGQCRRSRTGIEITDYMICAGRFKRGGKDACQGDTGGPLMVKLKNRHTLAGIVSYGYGCGEKDAPGVYTRVAKFMYMIKRVTKGSCYCKL